MLVIVLAVLAVFVAYRINKRPADGVLFLALGLAGLGVGVLAARHFDPGLRESVTYLGIAGTLGGLVIAFVIVGSREKRARRSEAISVRLPPDAGPRGGGTSVHRSPGSP